MSGRKCAGVRGGLIATNEQKYYDLLLPWLPVYEGFATYGGMSTKEVEAMAVGLREMTQQEVASAAADFVKYFVERLDERGVPVVKPAGGLACHVDARRFLPHVPSLQYTAGALAAAIYIASGVRSMERGTVSMERDEDGNEAPRTWSWRVWQSRGGSTRCRTLNTPLIASPGSTSTVSSSRAWSSWRSRRSCGSSSVAWPHWRTGVSD